MLKKLTIQNYALIESLDIDFPHGLVIITGETGAGKSILLGALSLLLGGKSDVSHLKDSSKNCVVEGEFDINGCGINIGELLDEDTNLLVLRRVVAPSGRSRAFINDEPVSLGELNSISQRLVDIHAQHEHLLLNNSAYQMDVLDNFAGNGVRLERYREIYSELREAKAKLKVMEEEIFRSAQEAEYKEFQLGKLEEAKLVDGELEELEQEQRKLANAEQIKSGLYGSLELLNPMGNSVVQNFKEAVHLLRKCYTFVPELEEVANRLESCRIECKDIEQELENYAANITVSPERLQIVDDRIALIEGLFKRFGCSSEKELIAIRDSLRRDIDGASMSMEQAGEQSRLVEELQRQLAESAGELAAARRAKVEELGGVLQERIRGLEMPYAKFSVELYPLGNDLEYGAKEVGAGEKALESGVKEGVAGVKALERGCNGVKYTENGCDGIRFMFSANGGERLVEISKVASGGELSRVMLCLKALMAKYTGMPTMIFDEIDTGVSGSIASKMGELIGEMGQSMQVFAITHLPQIAVKGETHLLVYKEFDQSGQARTNIKELSGEERVKEVARMLSGEQLSQAAIENAKYLLSNKN